MRHYNTKEVLLDEYDVVGSIKEWAYPLREKSDLQPLFEKIGNARIVMLGEASYGTHEFYTWRSYITRRLIEEKGFHFIAVEGDWPDCYRLNRFIKGYDQSGNHAADVLNGFNRWPTWLWANRETAALANWLHRHNENLDNKDKVGFYGLDVYSLWESIDSILTYLCKTDKATLQIAEKAFQCFEPYRNEKGISYTKASMIFPELCEQEVLQMLKKIRRKSPVYESDYENTFNAEQNALVAVNAEKYYRSMIQGGPHSWNVRDRQMADTLDRLLKFKGDDAKVIVWEHNTHIGDARATDMIDESILNVGELVRMRHQDKGVVLVGFGSYEGSVVAARKWRADREIMQVPPAKKGSWEYLLHAAGEENKLLLMEDFIDNSMMMENHIPHRAIGVVYDPKHEKYGKYVPSVLPLRYDAFIYLEQTTALHPLYMKAEERQMSETYPFDI